MNKPDLERHCRAMRDAISEALRRIRMAEFAGLRGSVPCRSCGADSGEQHKPTCAMWPLIEARAAYAMAADAESEPEALL